MKTFLNKITAGKSELIRSIGLYAAAGIEIEILEISSETATVKITQSRLVNGYILNQKQLVDRCKNAFNPTGLKVKVVPIVFSLQVENINEEWIEAKMNEFGIKRNDLIKQLAIEKSYLSLLFAKSDNKRKIHLSRPMKSLFYYYFLTYELNLNFRE